MLTSSRNPQVRHVGNLGDVLKHAALHELASMLATSRPAVRWIETNTYLLHAPLAGRDRWEQEVAALTARLPAYARYVAHQRHALSRSGRYRCSSAVAIDALGDRRASATLGEANGATRAELREQLRDEGLTDVVVADDDLAALRHAARDEGGVVLVHVDPFALDGDAWARIAPALDEVCARASEAVVVVYRYTRRARAVWPSAPGGTLGPVAETRGGPHELAAYVSAGLVEPVRRITAALGWSSPRG